MKTIILFLFLSLNLFAQSPLLTLFDSDAPDSLGADILLGHGTFTTAADTLFWSKDPGTGAIIMTGGKCHFQAVNPDGSGIYKLAYASLEVGKTYRVEFTISNITSGGLHYFYIGSTSLTPIVALTEAGTYTYWGTCTANSNIIIGTFDNSTLDIDNIKIEEVLP